MSAGRRFPPKNAAFTEEPSLQETLIRRLQGSLANVQIFEEFERRTGRTVLSGNLGYLFRSQIDLRTAKSFGELLQVMSPDSTPESRHRFFDSAELVYIDVIETLLKGQGPREPGTLKLLSNLMAAQQIEIQTTPLTNQTTCAGWERTSRSTHQELSDSRSDLSGSLLKRLPHSKDTEGDRVGRNFPHQ
jgi:hypothetical protein